MKAKNSYITYFLTRSLFLGYGFSLLFDETNKDAYFGMTLGLLLGIFITYLYTYIIKKKGNRSLNDIFKSHKVIGTITKIILFLTSIFILLYILVIYKLFVVSFLLVNTPEVFVTIPFIILCCYAAFKNIKVTARIAGSLLPISIILSIIIILSLSGLIETTNLMPLFTVKPSNFFKTVVFFTGLSTLPNVLCIHLNGEVKGMIKTYVIASVLLIITSIFINGVLGESLVNIFRFPEYMVLKQVKLFRFIEKIENIFSIIWIFDLLIAAIMCTYSIKECIPFQKNKIITVGLLGILMYIIDRFFAFNYVNELKIYFILPYISLILPILLIILMIYLVKSKKH